MYDNKHKIISIVNQKGGVGKTTTCIALASIAANRGNRTLIIDLDPNCHSTSVLTNKKIDITYNSYTFLTGSNYKKAIKKTAKPNIHLMPAVDKLYSFEKKHGKEPLKSIVLNKRLEKLIKNEQYQYIIIDCCSTVGALQFNAVTAANMVIIPAIPDFLSLAGFNQLLLTLRRINNKYNKLCNYYLLFTMFQEQLKSHKSVVEWARNKIKDITFKNKIPFDEVFLEANNHGVNFIDEMPASHGSQSYVSVYTEMQNLLKES